MMIVNVPNGISGVCELSCFILNMQVCKQPMINWNQQDPTLMILRCIAKKPLLRPVIKVVRTNHGFKLYGSLLFPEKY
jgi:hypothetical protein